MLFTVLSDLARAALRRVTVRSRAFACPVCRGATTVLGEVDFNKSCEDKADMRLPKSNTMVRYYTCDICDFCFAPEFRNWPESRFKERIYNHEYVLVDPDYVTVRPHNSAKFIGSVFGSVRHRISHLDYGGGSGLLSELLRANGWQSSSYDQFVDGPDEFGRLSTYDLVTAFEVFEHVVDPLDLMASLSKLAHPQSLIMFTTVLSDGHIARGEGLGWWYLAPRNGHVSLYSKHSLTLLLSAHGYDVLHWNEAVHVAFRELPGWSKELPMFRSLMNRNSANVM